MKFRVAFLLLIACFTTLQAQNCRDIDDIISLVNERHFSPPVFDQVQAKKSINHIFNELDPYHLVFLQSDLTNAHLNAGDFFQDDNFCSFTEALAATFIQRIEEANAVSEGFHVDWLDLYSSENFLFSEEASFAENANERDENWKKWSVYKYNSILYRFIDSKEEKSQEDWKKMYLDNIECFFSFFNSKNEDENRKLVLSSCFNSILSSCDPHSNYFTNELYNTFENDLSKDFQSFGFSVYSNKLNELIIENVSFNSPAFYSKNIKEDDKLLAIVWTDKTKDELVCAKAFEVNERLMLTEETKITLILKKAENDEAIEVELEKSSIENEKNSVNGFILNGEKKVAYISLPSFYENGSSSIYGCANDIAKELTLLKKEGIEGLIFDLRNNGGGSIQEAIELSGIFINEGPLLIDSSSFYDDVIVLKDVNRGMIYSGPMLVMVNGKSASASEMFASVMKDYNRALVVGSTTFGKASGQSTEDIGKTGTVKITELQLCNLKGKSYQKEGIEPDISFPLVGLKREKEADYPFALNPISVVKKTYYNPLKTLPISVILEKSKARTSQSDNFKLLNNKLDKYNKIISDDEVSLNFNTFALKNKEYETLRKELNDLKFEHDLFNVELHSYMKEMLVLNLNQKSSIDTEKEEIFDDLLIQESYNILIDLINLR